MFKSGCDATETSHYIFQNKDIEAKHDLIIKHF